VNSKNKTAFLDSPLNREYLALMLVHDSLRKQYGIMRAMYYPYTHMPEDSAKWVLQTYLPVIDSMSEIEYKHFYQAHPASFLTLENIYYRIQNFLYLPKHNASESLQSLKDEFYRLDKSLSRYCIYCECEDLWRRKPQEYPAITIPVAKPD
jgi:hypothetical protein